MTAASGDDDVVLCFNAGSSSLKLAVFRCVGDRTDEIARGAVEGIGAPRSSAWMKVEGARQSIDVAKVDAHTALESAFTLLRDAHVPSPTIVGHRVVHGGDRFVAPVRVDAALLDELRALVSLAPLHLPAAIDSIDAAMRLFSGVPHVACFDTAFFATLPEVARRLPIPDRYATHGLRRYGFHGLSYEYVLATIGDALPSRVVVAHLGNGASLVAVKDGAPIDTTMGLTPAGGIPMGTRTGDLDPGVLIHLLREEHLGVDALEQLVVHESGLLAVGGTSDVKTLLANEKTGDARASLALAMFGGAIRKTIGAYAAALGGIDLLVFTGGIGEHAAEVREAACRELGFMGVVIDAERNAAGAEVVSAEGSRCVVRVIETDEDRVIARHASMVVRSAR